MPLLLFLTFLLFRPDDPPASGGPSFALVELYTSQGCSSCPPADRVLETLTAKARAEGLPVYTLSFHVDYWNRLGWTDPYSQAAFSRRQRTYAGKLSERVYTPQMIVNGKEVFVGSRPEQAARAVADALQQEAGTRIELAATARQGDRQTVTARFSGRTEGVSLYYALVDARLGNAVPRGENAGRKLAHVQVVRHLGSAQLRGAQARFTVDWSQLDRPARGQLIVFAQDEASWAVTGARCLDRK